MSITDAAGGEVTDCNFAGNDGASIVVSNTRSPVLLSGNNAVRQGSGHYLNARTPGGRRREELTRADQR